MSTEERTPPPPLEFREPHCSMCFEETRLTDDAYGLTCDSCKATWSFAAYFGMPVNEEPKPGEWDEPEPRCLYREAHAARQFHAGLKAVQEVTQPLRCLLAQAHEEDHILAEEGADAVTSIHHTAPRVSAVPPPRRAVTYRRIPLGKVQDVKLP